MGAGLHPAARILLACGWAGAVELAPPAALGVFALAASAVLPGQRVRAQTARLLRRSRWLFLVLFLTYAWSLPGASLAPALGVWSPSLPGLEAGALRLARLALIVAGVAVLLASTVPARLVYGLYTLAAPFAWLGVDARALAVRTGLALEFAQAAPAVGDWRHRFACAERDAGEPAVYHLQREPWRIRDGVALGALAALLGALAASGGVAA